MNHTAYSVLTVKAIDADQRVIRGVATTPTVDRVGDIVEPLGVKFENPLPLLWQHRHDAPVGEVTFNKPTRKGITFEARLPKIDEPGTLKDRVDEAWQSVKAGLVKGVSIGFRNVKHAVMENGGWQFLETEVFELSLVTIPANAEATIQNIKSADRQIRAASGPGDQRDHPPGDTGSIPDATKARYVAKPEIKETRMSYDIDAQVAELEERRAELTADMKGFGDVTDLDDEQSAEFDRISGEFDEVETNLARAKRMQRAASEAKAIETKPHPVLRPRETTPAQPKKELAKGMGFTRYVMAMAAGRGSISDALEYAKRWGDDSRDVTRYIKAVAGSTLTGTGDWGSQLVYADNLASEFVEYLRPMTVLGRINGLRRVPFNVRIPVQTAGSTVDWVGEAAVKGVTELAFSDITVPYHKLAGIVVLSEELIRLSSPSAEDTVRRDLAEQISQFIDEQFLTTSITATASRPASITNGVTAVTASGTDADAVYNDLHSAMAPFRTANISTASLHILMDEDLAGGISSMRNALGQPEFPTMTPQGGTLLGYPVIVSNSVPNNTIVLAVAAEIFLADDGAVRIDASNQATLDMAGGASPTYNLWQRNAVGIRAERWITWLKRRSSAVAVIGSAAYGPSTISG